MAEDHEINQLLAKRMLERWGHQVTLADDGTEAVRLFEEQSFDLILMDIQMPKMDGYEAVGVIRALEGGGEIPIVAVTAHAIEGDRERCLAAGMDAYVTKPLDRSLLKTTVESFFPQLREEADSGPRTPQSV